MIQQMVLRGLKEGGRDLEAPRGSPPQGAPQLSRLRKESPRLGKGEGTASKAGGGGDTPRVPPRTHTLHHAPVVTALDTVAVVEPADGGVGQAGHLALQHGLLGQSHLQVLQGPQEVGHGQPLQFTLLRLLGDGRHLLQLRATKTTRLPRGPEHCLPSQRRPQQHRGPQDVPGASGGCPWLLHVELG